MWTHRVLLCELEEGTLDEGCSSNVCLQMGCLRGAELGDKGGDLLCYTPSQEEGSLLL